jgi:O-antigen/teichoic acid export membrane protein
LLQLKLKTTIIYTILGFLPLSFSLIFTPVYTKYLSREDYGLLNLFNVISGLLIPFFGLGIDQAAGFLYWDYSKDKKKLAEFMSTTISLIFLIAIIILLFGILFGESIINTFVKNGSQFSLWPFLILALVYPFFMILSRILLYYYRNEGDIKKYAALNLSTLILITAGSIVGVITLNKGAAGAVEGRTIGFCGIIFIFILYEIKKIGLNYNKSIAKLLLVMGGPLFLSTLIGTLAYVADRLIIEQLGTLEMLGVYGFAATIASVVEILMSALGNSFIPVIYKSILEEDEAYYKKTRFQLFIFIYSIIAVVVLITAVITPFVKLFISSNFYESIQYIPMLCISFIPRVFAQIFSLKLYKKKKSTYLLFLNIGYLISISLFGPIFYHFFGIKGIVLSVFITGLINMLLSFLISQKIDDFNFKFTKLYVFFSIISASTLALWLVQPGWHFHYLFYTFPLIMFIVFSLLIHKEECLEIKKYIISLYYNLFEKQLNKL